MKTKFPRVQALEAAQFLVRELNGGCMRIVVAGSLRRGTETVGDVEILYVPIMQDRPDGLFDKKAYNLADEILELLLKEGQLKRRQNAKGHRTWGPKNKHAVHSASGIPVDFFETTEACWFNYLVCRTGPAASNVRIAAAAKAKGWKWNPYGEGFTDQEGNLVRVCNERDVFALVGLPYLEPKDRK